MRLTDNADSWFKVNEDRNIEDLLNYVDSIYSRIDDEISQEIYSNCLLYSLTNDSKYIRRNIDMTYYGHEFSLKLKRLSYKHPIIYGAGVRGKRLLMLYPDIEWGGYCDRNCKKDVVLGHKVIPLSEVSQHSNSVFIISNMLEYELIKKDLMDQGILESNIVCLEEWNKKAIKDQYFEERCISGKCRKGGFLDCGAFDGKDTLEFLKRFGKEAEAWVFEPDSTQMRICKREIQSEGYGEDRIHYYEVGVSDQNENVRFSVEKGGLSRVSVNGTNSIACGIIDDIVGDDVVGMIKMDVEGYEEKAIMGAQNIISKQKPLMAIAIYHKRLDIIYLPKIILGINRNYRFALGHYSIGQVDTVLYAY